MEKEIFKDKVFSTLEESGRKLTFFDLEDAIFLSKKLEEVYHMHSKAFELNEYTYDSTGLLSKNCYIIYDSVDDCNLTIEEIVNRFESFLEE